MSDDVLMWEGDSRRNVSRKRLCCLVADIGKMKDKLLISIIDLSFFISKYKNHTIVSLSLVFRSTNILISKPTNMKKSESLVTRVTIADDGGMFLLILSVSTLMQVKLALRVSGREALIILSLSSHRACMWIHTSIVS